MKRKTAILLAILVLVLGVAVVLIIGKPAGAADDPAPKSTADIAEGEDTSSTGEDDKDENKGGETKPPQKPGSSPEPTAAPMPEEPAKCSYEVFYALSPEQKDAFLHSFESYDAFYEWLVAAQAEFAKLHPEIEIGPDGTIDLSKLGQ